MERLFVEKLESKRLYFRPFRVEDSESVFEYSSDEETVKYLTWKAHSTIDQTIATIKDYLMKPGIYAIVLKTEEKVIGCIDIRLLENNKATFGYVLNRKYWNMGYMSEALQSFIDYMFKKLNIDEIIGIHEKGNDASATVMKKCHMRLKSVVKNEKINNKVADYSLVCIQFS